MASVSKKYCIYRHLKPCGEIFYIGIGNLKRPYSKKKNTKGKFWFNIVHKLNYNYEIDILKKDLTWKDACELEITLIDFYGRRDLKTGSLCNMTGGGEGRSKPSLELIEKLRNGPTIFKKGRKYTKKMIQDKIDNNPNAKKVICIKSGKLWNSIKQCSDDNNINPITLSCYLSGHRKNKTTFKYFDYV